MTLAAARIPRAHPARIPCLHPTSGRYVATLIRPRSQSVLPAGQGSDGTEHADSPTLRAELAQGKSAGVWIQLPDDENGGLRWWRLRVVSLLAMSLDWLANGSFGPFAESVSARYPCFKCDWTPSCRCAWLPCEDERHCQVVHEEGCRGRTPRTHAGTLDAVREMRAFKGTKTALAKQRTTTGIFSTHFPSEHLLKNIVKDVTVDIMHVFVCGITRHLILWVTDMFIPADFSWSELNASKNVSTYARAKHVPDLEPTIGSPRSQKSIHLSGADTLHFAVASIEIIEPLLKRKDHPAWICWKAHVKLLRFVTRDSYSRSSNCSHAG